MIFPLTQRKIIRGFQDHIDAGLGGAVDYVASIGTPIYSPFYGTIYHFQEAEGGNWIGIKRDDGYRFEFAHLSEYIALDGTSVKPGDNIALSGNTGTLTTMPHVHHQIIDPQGNRVDPEQSYFAISIPIIAINGELSILKSIQASIELYSQGMLTINWNNPMFGVPTFPNQDESYALIDSFIDQHPEYAPNRYFFVFSGATNAVNKTYYDPAKDCCISVIAVNENRPSALAYEFINQLVFYYNEHRGVNPYVPTVDSNFPDDSFITTKCRSVLPYTDILI